MKKRKRERVLALILVFVLASVASVANATLILSVDNNIVDITDPCVVAMVDSDDNSATTWGVYLDPTSDFDNNYAKLQNPVTLRDGANGDVGSAGGVTSSTAPAAGHDYQSAGGQRQAGLWSTVDFVGLTVGTYTITLYDSAGTTGTVLDTETIQVIPEPATIALLGLGGLLLMRRRK